MMRQRITYLLVAGVMVVAACGGGSEEGGSDGGGDGGSSEVTQPAHVPADCVVTIPDGSFVPPAEYPATPQGNAEGWYGTDELWTNLVLDGKYQRRKTQFWSVNFEGGATEPKPEIQVTWVKLDDSSVDPIVLGPPGTQASTVAQGDHMIGGSDPIDKGCWEVTATYKGASLTYVYYLG